MPRTEQNRAVRTILLIITSSSDNDLVCLDLSLEVRGHLEASTAVPAGSSQCPPEAPNARRRSGDILKRERSCVLGSVVGIRELRWAPNARIKVWTTHRENNAVCSDLFLDIRELRWAPNVRIRYQCQHPHPMLASASNVRIPSLNSVQLERPCVLGSVVYGFDTKCGNSEGNARSPVNLDKYNNEVLEPKPKYGNLHMMQTPPLVKNQGMITQDWKVHRPEVKTQENYIAS